MMYMNNRIKVVVWLTISLASIGHVMAASIRPCPVDPIPKLEGCDFQKIGTRYDACWLAPSVCENGPFTEKEICHASVQTNGCRGIASPLVELVTSGSGDALTTKPCGSLGRYHVMKCRCSGNIFGFCLGPCTPTAGIIETRNCPGSIMTLKPCDQKP
jgi:hypothetical protein